MKKRLQTANQEFNNTGHIVLNLAEDVGEDCFQAQLAVKALLHSRDKMQYRDGAWHIPKGIELPVIVHGEDLKQVFPDIEAVYDHVHGQVEDFLDVEKYGLGVVNIKVYDGNFKDQDFHSDENEFSALLYLTDNGSGETELELLDGEKLKVLPATGRLLFISNLVKHRALKVNDGEIKMMLALPFKRK